MPTPSFAISLESPPRGHCGSDCRRDRQAASACTLEGGVLGGAFKTLTFCRAPRPAAATIKVGARLRLRGWNGLICPGAFVLKEAAGGRNLCSLLTTGADLPARAWAWICLLYCPGGLCSLSMAWGAAVPRWPSYILLLWQELGSVCLRPPVSPASPILA